jgi:hypothetical protein
MNMEVTRFTCSVCGTYSIGLTTHLRLLPEPYISWDCILCFPIQDAKALEIQRRDLQPCSNCGMFTKRIPVCSTECLIQKELDNETRKVA